MTIQEAKAVLDTMDPDWQRQLSSDAEGMGEEEKQAIRDLIYATRTEAKERASVPSEVEPFWKELSVTLEDSTVSFLRDRVDSVISIYFDLSPLRDRPEKDAAKLLKESMEETVVYTNYYYAEKFQEYGFENEQRFVGFLHALHAVVDTYVTMILSPEAAKREMTGVSGISDSMGNVFKQLYQEHFHQLQLNHIQRELDEFGEEEEAEE